MEGKKAGTKEGGLGEGQQWQNRRENMHATPRNEWGRVGAVA